MRAVTTGRGGEVDVRTLFRFRQQGTIVWARYSGGSVCMGHLVGTLAPGRLAFRYVQVDLRGEVHAGRSVCDIQELPDGRLRLLEHFEWDSREGAGTNVLEQVTE
jgi:hypothetical protein